MHRCSERGYREGGTAFNLGSGKAFLKGDVPVDAGGVRRNQAHTQREESTPGPKEPLLCQNWACLGNAVCESARAAVTEYHRPGDLNNRSLRSHNSEG